MMVGGPVMGKASESMALPTAGDASQKASSKYQLKVEDVWHEQVHQSRVSSLLLSGDGSTLFSACDAAAPKQVELPDVQAAAVCTQDGALLHKFGGGSLHNVRLILDSQSQQLSCITDQGRQVNLRELDGSELGLEAAGEEQAEAAAADEQQVQEAQAAPGQDAAALAEGEPDTHVPPNKQEEGLPLEQAAPPGAAAAAPLGPEFIATTGYRGVREGYLFRPGVKGMGYYRKDVVRLYAPARLPRSAAGDAGADGTPASAAAGSSNGGGAAPDDQDLAAEPAAVGSQRPSANAASNANSATYLQRLMAARPGIQAALAAPDGTLLFTSSLGPRDNCVRVWQLSQSGSEQGTGQQEQPMLLHTLAGHTAPVLSLALSPDGGLLFTGSHDYTIRAWSTADWSCVRVLKGHGGGVRALAVSPDGGMLYSAAGDNTLRAWSTKLWVCLRTLHGRHEDTTWPCCLALSPDGELLASGSNGLFGGSTIKVFQTRSAPGREAGACLATFAQLGYNEKGSVSALAFCQDSRYLYSGASDGTLAAWRLDWVDAAVLGVGKGIRKGFL